MKEDARKTPLPIPTNQESQNTGLPVVDMKVFEEPAPVLARMQLLFRATTGLDAFLFSRDLSTGNWRETAIVQEIQFPRFCRLVRSTRKGFDRCLNTHQSTMQDAGPYPHTFHKHCHAGLLCLHFPVSLATTSTQSEALANVQTVCALDHTKEAFDIAYGSIADLGLSKECVSEALNCLPVLSSIDVENATEWLHILTGYMSDLSRIREAVLNNSVEHLRRRPFPGMTLEEEIRFVVGASVQLPPRGRNLCCAVTPLIVSHVIQFLDRFFYLPLTTQTVAQALGFEPTFFGRMFKQHAGISMTDCLRRTRLEHARILLKNPYLSVKEVAEQVGFADPSHFTQVFRMEFGITPVAFRAG